VLSMVHFVKERKRKDDAGEEEMTKHASNEQEEVA